MCIRDSTDSSFYDGVSLEGIQPGQVAMIDAEIIRIDARASGGFTIARGVYDTVPAKHLRGARVWFFEAGSGDDPTAYPYTGTPAGSSVEVKMVPEVYGPPLDLAQIPTDMLDMKHRVERPYPPGEVLVNGRPWYEGAQVATNTNVRITWNHRNRDTQGGQAVDHHAATRAPEDGQKYHLSIVLTLYDSAAKRSYTVTVRDDTVEGTEYIYTYEMATADGYRAGSLMKVCGRVTVGITLEAVRGDFVSWQNYVIPLLLPSYACPAGQTPGGGQLPPSTGNGNGDVSPNPNPPNDNTGGSDPDPGSDPGDNGSGPPAPPDVPPDWPDPIDPPEEPEPVDPNPQLAAHWDLNWDRHWDAYTKDNQGG